MKKHLLHFIVLLFTYVPVSAQKAPLLDTTNQWLMALDYQDGMAGRHHNHSRWAVLDTPAVYNELEYTVINAYYHAYGFDFSWQGPYCFREDTLTGTIFIKKCDTISDEIIYMKDDLDIGDTLNYYGFLSHIFGVPDTIYLVTTAVGYDTFINRITNLPDSVRYYIFDLGFSNSYIDTNYYNLKKPRFSFLKGFDTGPVIGDYHFFENDIWRTVCFWNQYSGSVTNLSEGIWGGTTGGPNTWWNIYGNTPCADIQLGVRGEILPDIQLYPNPADKGLHITGVLDPDAEITGLNSTGQVLIHTPFQPQLDVADLPNGLFILLVIRNGAPVGSARFWKSEL